MSKAASALLGYNNNVRHKSRVFHIQTEDSGVKYGHIITHLFMDGGRILKSVKTSYAEYLGNDKMADIVREMMKQQHKAMFIALRDGKFDHLVEGVADVSQQTKALVVEQAAAKLAEVRAAQEKPEPAAAKEVQPAPAPAEVAPAPVVVNPLPVAAVPPPPPSAPPPRPPTPFSSKIPPKRVSVSPLAPSANGRRPSTKPRAADDDSGPQTERTPPEELTLDIEALERAAAAADAATSTFKPSSDLPPPPTNLFREKTATGQYRSLSQPPPPASAPPPAPAGGTPGKPPPLPPPKPPAERRYAPTRPASIFGQARPQTGKTIFGEDLISDKSLDEVILSYLADDLDPPVEKK